jgi:hypothetical protein
MKLQELFAKNKNIIINTDIDGILSGVILCNYCGCKVAGFSNSKETVWLSDDIPSVYEPVYIDMFVPRCNVYCVDQHIVSVNDTHHDMFVKWGTKLNPQFDRHRIFKKWDYTYKYPFGAVHYIIAMLEKEGIKINLPDLRKIVDDALRIRLGDLLLRADDAMKTTLDSNYMTNARDWWGWLLVQSDNAKSVKNMFDFLYRDTNPSEVVSIKTNTKKYLNTHFLSRTSDGGFSQITDSQNNLLPNIQNYIDEIGKQMGMPIQYPLHYTPHKGIYKLLYWSSQWEDEFVNHGTIDGEEVFSYAFIYSPGGRYQNFSFTVNMK